MKIATWNVNSLTVRLPQVLDWLEKTSADILAIQETKITDKKFPHDAFSQAGYQSLCFGQKAFNGVAIISKKNLKKVTHNIPGHEDPQARTLACTVDNIRLVNAYFPNGQAPESEKFEYKMKWLQAMEHWLVQELKNNSQLILLGDFNIAPTDADVYDPQTWKNHILCTPQERQHFQKLLNLGLEDAFRIFEQPAKSWSWWDYRQLAFRKNQGLRIDHILTSTALRPYITACTIDKEPRKNERPSDHTPVVITLTI